MNPYEIYKYIGEAIDKFDTNKTLSKIRANLNIVNVAVCGGIFRSFYEGRDSPTDIDLYLLNAEEQQIDGLSKLLGKPRCIDQRFKEVVTWKVDKHIQIISIKYLPSIHRANMEIAPSKNEFVCVSNPAEIIEGFDFTCCQAAANLSLPNDVNDLVIFPDFLEGIARKQLILSPEVNMYKSPTSLGRLYKYVHTYGYKAAPEVIAALTTRLVEGVEWKSFTGDYDDNV